MKTTLFILFLLLGAAWTKSPVAHTVLVFKTSFCSSDLEETSFMVLSIESLVDMLDTLYCDIFQGNNNTDKLVLNPELQARSDITTCVECIPSITSIIETCALSGNHHGRYIQTLNLAQNWFNKIFIQDLVKIFNKIEKKKKRLPLLQPAHSQEMLALLWPVLKTRSVQETAMTASASSLVRFLEAPVKPALRGLYLTVVWFGTPFLLFSQWNYVIGFDSFVYKLYHCYDCICFVVGQILGSICGTCSGSLLYPLSLWSTLAIYFSQCTIG